MKLNLTNSFVYMFRDKSWILKFLCIIGLLLLFGMLLFLIYISVHPSPETFGRVMFQKIILFFISFLLPFLFIGNIAHNANRRIYENTDLLYEWRGNFLKILKTALSAYAIVLIIFILYYCFFMHSFKEAEHVSNIQPIITKYYIFHLGVMFLYYVGYLSFIRDLKFVSFFNVPAIIKIVSKNYGIPFIVVTAVQILIILASDFLSNITQGYSTLFLLPYILYVFSDLHAQLVRQAFETNESLK